MSDALDAAMDMLIQKLELRFAAKHRYDKARVGKRLDAATVDLNKTTADLRRAITAYHQEVRASLAEPSVPS